MSSVDLLLSQRLKKGKASKSSKMAEMAKQSATGNLTTFAGIFSINELSEKEKNYLEAILREFSSGTEEDIGNDLTSLISITSEVKAINNQAAILHGERINRAHKIFIKYKEGAFTAWMIAAYGNRQTPYNFMQYYLFHEQLPEALRAQIELMPRQAIYTLASREGEMDQKIEIIANYNGETKSELLHLIREKFPLNSKDKRAINYADRAITTLTRALFQLKNNSRKLSKQHKRILFDIIHEIQEFINNE